MKKIGIIGGAGPLASSLLLENVVHECYKQGCKSETEFPEIVLLNHPFSITLCTQCTKDNRPMICDVLQTCVDRLVGDGVQLIAVACNTFHLFLDGVNTGKSYFVSIAQATLDVAQHQALSQLMILGTPLTLHNKLYQHATINCIAPPEDDQALVEHIINRILRGNVLAEDSQLLSSIITNLQQKYFFDGIVLGCTELPVLHKRYPLQVASNNEKIVFLDTIQVLAKHLVEQAIT